MKPVLPALALILLWTVAPARAHRLDEFLQAATIAVQRDHVTVQLRLTPGVAVARAVLAELDPDGDGVLSEAERQAYVERLRGDLSLSVDGEPLTLRPGSQWFPPTDEIHDGTGEIFVRFDVDVPPGGTARRLVFENRHRGVTASYLVNCLVPDGPGLRVVAQDRSFDQSFYQLDYVQATVRSDAPPVATATGHAEGVGPLGPLLAANVHRETFHFLTGGNRWLFIGTSMLVAVLWGAVAVFTPRSTRGTRKMTKLSLDRSGKTLAPVQPTLR